MPRLTSIWASPCGKLSDRDHAVPELQAAAKLSPEVFEYRYRLGSAYQRTGDYEHSIAELRQAVALDASKSPAWDDLGQCVAKQR